MKQPITALLLSALLLATLGCGDTSAETKETNPADDTAAVTETEELNEREQVSDDLPEKDYGGKPFRIFLRQDFEYEFDVKETDGETINDAVFARNADVAERFNITYETTAESAIWGQGIFNKAIANSVTAGDNAYDIVAGYMCDITPTVTQGIYLNWKDIPCVNLEKPWWSSLMIDAYTINDRIYMITGDLALSYWRSITGIAFNKQLASDFDLEDLYTVTREGRWTYEKMTEISKDIATDLDGNGTWDEKDRYGFTSNYSTGIDAFKEAFGLNVVIKDEDGLPKLDVASDRCVEVLDGLANFYKNHYGYMANADQVSFVEPMFLENRAMFMSATFSGIESLRNMDTDFGILPYPKWNEAQEIYGTTINDSASVFLVPKTIDDPEFVGIITEALAAESYKHVVPAYYDVVLKTKASRDEESAEMIDLIRDCIVVDFGYMHSTALDTVGHLFVQQARTNNPNIVSAFKSKEKAAQKKLDAIIDFYYSDDE